MKLHHTRAIHATAVALLLTVFAELAPAAQEVALSITNPVPGFGLGFGVSAAVVGDSFAIGHLNGSATSIGNGAVHLYSSNGVLKRTFSNPNPSIGRAFGYAIAAVGNDRVLISAPYSDTPFSSHPGIVYLYHTNGTLLRTFLRPSASQPRAHFGVSVTAVGTDLLLIGADADNRAGAEAGAAYLFRTNGTLITTYTNSVPREGEYFGGTTAALGTDRVVIGSLSGSDSVLLFSTNGTVLATFSSPFPMPIVSFGRTLATLGTDLIAIGAPLANVMSARGGVVFLFQTNGVLFGPALTDPSPANDNSFGMTITASGNNRLLVTSYDRATGGDGGAVYLFSTNLSLLSAIKNPPLNNTPVGFGFPVAPVSSERVIIGAPGTSPAGSAVVYDLKPWLNIARSPAGSVTLSWSSEWTGWNLEENTRLLSDQWQPSTAPVTDDGIYRSVPFESPAHANFFRLRKQ